MKTTRTALITVAILTWLPVAGAHAQSGAKALFYGSSGAMLQSNAPGPGVSQGMPAPPSSTLGTGYPTTPGMPAIAAPPTSPPTSPGALPAASTSTPTSGQDPAKLADELKALTNAVSATTPPPAAPAALPTVPSVPMPGAAPATSDSTAGALPPLPPPPTLASGADGTKSLAAPTHMGVKYWVELVDASGRPRQITTEQVFRAGDRIKLHVVANRDGYLTLVNVGSTGKTNVLFPSASTAAGNFVKAGADYAVPASGYLRFDANPGQETLILTFSPAPMAPPATAAAAMAMTRGSKDLVQEVDASSPQPATYAVAPAAQGAGQATVAIQIKLNHQ